VPGEQGVNETSSFPAKIVVLHQPAGSTKGNRSEQLYDGEKIDKRQGCGVDFSLVIIDRLLQYRLMVILLYYNNRILLYQRILKVIISLFKEFINIIIYL